MSTSMDMLEVYAEEYVNYFIKEHDFQCTESLLMYSERLNEMHKEENCEECLSKYLNKFGEDNGDKDGINCNEGSSKGLDINARTSTIGSEFLVKSFIGGSFGSRKPSLSRKSRKSVCIPKIRYSTSESDSDEKNENSDNDNDEVFLGISSSIQREDSNEGKLSDPLDNERHIEKDEETCISEKLTNIKISSSDEVATKKEISDRDSSVSPSCEVLADDDDNDGNDSNVDDVDDGNDDNVDDVVVKKKKKVCKVSSGGSSSEQSGDDNSTGDENSTGDDYNTKDRLSFSNATSGAKGNSNMLHSTSKDNVFNVSSDDDSYDEEKYTRFLSTFKGTKNTGRSDEYSPDEDDSYDSDSFIVKDVESRQKKKPLKPKVTNLKTPATSIKDFKTPAPSFKGLTTPASNIRGMKTPAPNIRGMKTPASNIRGMKTPASNIRGMKTPASSIRGMKTPGSSIRDVMNQLVTPLSVPGTPVYKRQFNKTREGVVKGLFSEYNRTVFNNRLPEDLQITWNKRLTKTAGFCYLSKSSDIRNARIELSDKVIDTVERIRDTLIHELCHAATWIFEGQKGHGQEWRYWAKKAKKEYTDLPDITTCHSYEIRTKYRYQCDGCGNIFGRHSKSIDHSKHSCANCGGRPLLISDNASASNTPRRLNPYTTYVKKHYAMVKRSNPTFSHTDIMKKLVEGFKERKASEDNKENAGSI